MFKPILDKISDVLDKLNSTPIKRLVIYAVLFYPLVLVHYYRDEISLVFDSYYDDSVKITELADIQERCFQLKMNYNAAAVVLYIYQPRTKHKNFKERIVTSNSNEYIPLEKNKVVQLSSRTRIIEDLKRYGYSKVTDKSGHHESAIVVAYDLTSIVFTPIKDLASDQIIGEVMWVFRTNDSLDLNTLSREGQIFAYNLDN